MIVGDANNIIWLDGSKQNESMKNIKPYNAQIDRLCIIHNNDFAYFDVVFDDNL